MRQLAKKLNMNVTEANGSPSEPGDSGIEVRSLGLQVISVLDLTADVVRRSGLERGMRVLDLGCGSGDTSLLIAKMVGASGLGGWCRQVGGSH